MASVREREDARERSEFLIRNIGEAEGMVIEER